MQAHLALTDELGDLLDRASAVVADNKEEEARNVAYRVLQSVEAEEKARNKLISTAASYPPQRQAEGGRQPPKPLLTAANPSSCPGSAPAGSPSSAKRTVLPGAS